MSKKISELDALTSADADDFVPIVDDSEDTTKKITVENLVEDYNKLEIVSVTSDETVSNSHHNTLRMLNPTSGDIEITVPTGLDVSLEVYYFRVSGADKVTFVEDVGMDLKGLSGGAQLEEDKSASLVITASDEGIVVGALENNP